MTFGHPTKKHMIFDSSRTHYCVYQKASEAAANQSSKEEMYAYISKDSTAKWPNTGDVIWLLARVDDTSPVRAKMAYAFIVDTLPNRTDTVLRFRGVKGLWLADSELVSSEPWFEQFFYRRLASGQASIREVGQEVLDGLRERFGDCADFAEQVDDLANLQVEADANDWPEDKVRFGAIRARRGQSDFRQRLLKAYKGRCCISGCDIEDILEAAHIQPHAAEPNYDTRNGLLLRADLHTLFDLNLLAVDDRMHIHLSQQVNDVYYRNLVSQKRQINVPDTSLDQPSTFALSNRKAELRS